jgi:acyl-CoA reductase-like NAD-dependent aldehyde dehydrogenase
MHNDGSTNYIGGRWRPAQDGRTFESTNPARPSDVIGAFALSGHVDVEEAVCAAAGAYPAWRRMPAPSRAAALARMGQLLQCHKEEIAGLMVREMGKVIVEARGDVQEAIDMAFYMAAFGRMPHGSVVPSERTDVFCYAQRVPMGVVGLITPWNFPIAIPSWKMFPALLAGNTVVFKPAEDTPALATVFVDLLEEAGVPPGVVNLVTGDGPLTGAALVESAGVGTISFTGSTETGRNIAARCGALMKRVSCELGGKNAIVVLGDANLELALKGVIWSAFGTSGQRCTAASRVIVQESVLPRFRAELVARTKALRVGDGSNPETDIGPVINRSQLQRIDEYVRIGAGEGADVLTGGEILSAPESGNPGALSGGYFYAPTVLGNVRSEMRIAQEEIFGPVTALIGTKDLGDAIAMANGTPYGLSLSIYTNDVSKAFRAIDELEAGIVYVNLPTSGAEIQLPFGGVKQTGNGHREAGWTAMDYCTEWKSVYVNYSGSAELVRAQIDTT